MATTDLGPANQQHARFSGLLYQLTLAFPSWAGATVALYALLLGGLAALRVRVQ